MRETTHPYTYGYMSYFSNVSRKLVLKVIWQRFQVGRSRAANADHKSGTLKLSFPRFALTARDTHTPPASTSEKKTNEDLPRSCKIGRINVVQGRDKQVMINLIKPCATEKGNGWSCRRDMHVVFLEYHASCTISKGIVRGW